MTRTWQVYGHASRSDFLYKIKEYDGTYYVDVHEGVFASGRSLSQHYSMDDAIEAINEHVQQEYGANPDRFKVEEED